MTPDATSVVDKFRYNLNRHTFKVAFTAPVLPNGLVRRLGQVGNVRTRFGGECGKFFFFLERTQSTGSVSEARSGRNRPPAPPRDRGRDNRWQQFDSLDKLLVGLSFQSSPYTCARLFNVTVRIWINRAMQKRINHQRNAAQHLSWEKTESIRIHQQARSQESHLDFPRVFPMTFYSPQPSNLYTNICTFCCILKPACYCCV